MWQKRPDEYTRAYFLTNHNLLFIYSSSVSRSSSISGAFSYAGIFFLSFLDLIYLIQEKILKGYLHKARIIVVLADKIDYRKTEVVLYFW